MKSSFVRHINNKIPNGPHWRSSGLKSSSVTTETMTLSVLYLYYKLDCRQCTACYKPYVNIDNCFLTVCIALVKLARMIMKVELEMTLTSYINSQIIILLCALVF